jgi:hypothetical protein
LIASTSRQQLAALVFSLEADLREVVREWLVPALPREELVSPYRDQLDERADRDGLIDPTPSTLIDFLHFGETVTRSSPRERRTLC